MSCDDAIIALELQQLEVLDKELSKRKAKVLEQILQQVEMEELLGNIGDDPPDFKLTISKNTDQVV